MAECLKGRANPGIGAIDRTLQAAQVVGCLAIRVLVQLEENRGLGVCRFLEPELTRERLLPRGFRVVPEPKLEDADPIGDHRGQWVEFLGELSLGEGRIEPPDGAEQLRVQLSHVRIVRIDRDRGPERGLRLNPLVAHQREVRARAGAH